MILNEKEGTEAGKLDIKEKKQKQKNTPKPAKKMMSLNDTFSAIASSPNRIKMDETFNESFSDKNTLSPITIFRCLQKEHEQISAVLRLNSPVTAQYQSSLIELISLYERAEEQSTMGMRRLILSVFLKLAANILTVLGKLTYQPTLYKLSQLIASSIVPDLKPDEKEEATHLQKWADRVVLESAIHMIDYPNYELDVEINIDGIVDDLLLASSNIQLVRNSIFVAALKLASEMDVNVHIGFKSKLTSENISDEYFLRLLLWLYLRNKNVLKTDLLSSLFSTLPLTLNAQEYTKSSECSLLDVNLYLVSLSVVASTTSESGMTLKSAPVIAAQLSLTKQQKDCWKAIVDSSLKKTVAALARLRTSQLVESVRLIANGSEDVRVLFEAWKTCLQPSATHDENVYEAIKTVTDKYITKMNSLLAYGPFYSTDAFSCTKPSSVSRCDMKTLFPLQFDYEFVNTTEAEHIGTVINSLEGYMSPEAEEIEKDEEEALSIRDDGSFGDDTFHSFGSASDNYTSANNSQFFSPLSHNRESMLPSAVSQLIRDDIANTSHFSTKSVILTPTRATAPPTQSVFDKKLTPLSFERHQTIVTPSKKGNKSDDSGEDEEVDELEAALLESTQKHERSILAQKTPEKPALVQKVMPTPTKDAQTETDASITSSGEGSISSVRYTPRQEAKGGKKIEPLYSSESEDGEYDEEDEEEIEYDEDEETEAEEDDDELLTEEQMEDMMGQILEATTTMFRDLRMKKFAIESQKIQFDNTTDDEILRLAELKLAKINTDISATSERLIKIRTPSVTTVFAPHPPLQATPQAANQLFKKSSVDHDPKQCLGCQSDDVQEAALRRLEQMAIDWDAEGNDYLYE